MSPRKVVPSNLIKKKEGKKSAILECLICCYYFGEYFVTCNCASIVLLQVPSIGTRCSSDVLKKLVASFDPKKKGGIESFGFGWVYKLKCTKVRQSLCKFFVSKFDIGSSSLSIGRSSIKVSSMDVHYILGLPPSDVDVNIDGEEAEFDELYNTHFQSTTVPILSELEEQLKAYGKAKIDDGFKVRFVLFVLGCFLCPTMHQTPKKEFIGCLRDLHSIGSVNWEKFVLEYLVDGIRQHEQKKQSGIHGCLSFLEVIKIMSVFFTHIVYFCFVLVE